jgi:hypothetical protein
MNAPLFLAENKQDIDQAKYTDYNGRGEEFPYPAFWKERIKGPDTFLGRNKE